MKYSVYSRITLTPFEDFRGNSQSVHRHGGSKKFVVTSGRVLPATQPVARLTFGGKSGLAAARSDPFHLRISAFLSDLSEFQQRCAAENS